MSKTSVSVSQWSDGQRPANLDRLQRHPDRVVLPSNRPVRRVDRWSECSQQNGRHPRLYSGSVQFTFWFKKHTNYLKLTLLSSSNNVCRANELWTVRICEALLSVRPFVYGSKDWQNSLKSVSVEPSFRSECLQFRSKLRIAWVAQALLMTCLAKNIVSRRSSLTTDPTGSSSCTHLKRKINPWIGLERHFNINYIVF